MDKGWSWSDGPCAVHGGGEVTGHVPEADIRLAPGLEGDQQRGVPPRPSDNDHSGDSSGLLVRIAQSLITGSGDKYADLYQSSCGI